MCGGPEQSLSPHLGRKSPCKADSTITMKKESPKPLDSCFCLLESAANDDLNSFKKCLEEGKANVDDIGLWYSRSNGAKQMVLEQRTALMIASLYGSLNVLRYLTSQYGMHGGDLDQTCGSDGSSALHCAAAGGSSKAIEAVYILLSSGADVNVCDIQGRRPADVISVPYGCADARSMLETLLGKDKMAAAKLQQDSNMFSQLMKCLTPSAFQDFRVDSALDGSSVESSISLSLPSNISGASTFSVSPSTSSSPKSPVASSAKGYVEDVEKGIECSVDQPVPDIKNSFYTSDEFRMYSFKIRPCSRAYSHDWTECPFAHPGENARRRDPRRYHYSCVPCPDFRKGACSQGDACEYAHGVFECWLHPAQYRTRLCKDGPECNRKVCFFAHKAEELRPVYAATGSGLPSPILSAFTDMSCMSPPLAPCSPSLMPPFSPLQPLQGTRQGNLRTPPMSPSSSLSNALWPQPSVPTLHLPGASLQASRLRAMLHARDVPSKGDFDEQLLSDFQSPSAHSLSTQARMNAAVAASGTIATASRSNRYKSLGLGLAPSNLEELFASENLAPSGIPAFEAPLVVQLEQDNHPVVLPASSSSGIKVHLQQSAALPSSREVPVNLESLAMWTRLYGEGQGGKMEAQGACKSSVSPVFGRTANKGNWDLGAGCIWSDWGSPTGKPEWGIHEEDLSKLRKSTSMQSRAATEEADRSRGRELPKEGQVFKQDIIKGGTPSKLFDDSEGMLQTERADASMLGSWIDNLSLDEIVA